MSVLLEIRRGMDSLIRHQGRKANAVYLGEKEYDLLKDEMEPSMCFQLSAGIGKMHVMGLRVYVVREKHHLKVV